MKIQLFLIATFVALQAFSKGVAPKENHTELKSVFQKFKNSALVKMDVEKKTKSELLGNETSAPGVIYISQEKFRWDTEGKEKSRIIYDGKTVWTIQDPPKGFKVPPQVTKMKMNKKSEGQLLLKSLFNDKFDSEFKVTKKTKTSDGMVYNLVPTKKNESLIHELEVRLNSANELKEISYSDEVQNKIQVMINKIVVSKKAEPKLFQYLPPADAQVTEI